MTLEYVPVAKAATLAPGRMIGVEVSGRRVLVANVDGQYLATDDLCTHEDACLSDGALNGDLVTCPLHGSRFSLRTGEPSEEPAEEALRCYEVRVRDGEILVGLDSET